MCYISMDSTRQALQTNENIIFSNFKFIFELTTIFLNNKKVSRWGGGIGAEQHAF